MSYRPAEYHATTLLRMVHAVLNLVGRFNSILVSGRVLFIPTSKPKATRCHTRFYLLPFKFSSNAKMHHKSSYAVPVLTLNLGPSSQPHELIVSLDIL